MFSFGWCCEFYLLRCGNRELFLFGWVRHHCIITPRKSDSLEITLAKAVFTINLESMMRYKETLFSFSHVSCLSVRYAIMRFICLPLHFSCPSFKDPQDGQFFFLFCPTNSESSQSKLTCINKLAIFIIQCFSDLSPVLSRAYLHIKSRMALLIKIKTKIMFLPKDCDRIIK